MNGILFLSARHPPDRQALQQVHSTFRVRVHVVLLTGRRQQLGRDAVHHRREDVQLREHELPSEVPRAGDS